jgi:hypothetical protein
VVAVKVNIGFMFYGHWKDTAFQMEAKILAQGEVVVLCYTDIGRTKLFQMEGQNSAQGEICAQVPTCMNVGWHV